MAKSPQRKTALSTAADQALPSRPEGSAHVTNDHIARRAYDLYLARGCEDGHAVDDWLQAERELREAMHATVRQN
jgi:Protein of unknown function (DUF2934)